MKPQHLALAALALFAVALTASAERPPQKRDEAALVLVGKVTKVTTAKEKFGKDGERTDYTATVEVAKVEKGDAKAGDTVEVHWFHVTKRPTGGFVGAFGQDHKLAKGDEAKFWLLSDGKKGWAVIYNTDGVEKVKK